jgi:hypothetical protein
MRQTCGILLVVVAALGTLRAAADDCERVSLSLYDSDCLELNECRAQYCNCVGLEYEASTGAPTPPNATSANFSDDDGEADNESESDNETSVPVTSFLTCSATPIDTNDTLTCEAATICIRSYANCVNARAADMFTASDSSSETASCTDAVLGADAALRRLRSGAESFDTSDLWRACAATNCRLQNELLLAGRTNSSCPLQTDAFLASDSAACLSPVSTNLTVTLEGSGWATIDANATFRSAVSAAVATDLHGVLERPVSMLGLSVGSLVAAAEVLDGPSEALKDRVRVALRNPSWLGNTLAVYAAAGFDPSAVYIKSFTVDGAEITDEDERLRLLRSADYRCDAGCIAAIVVGSCVAALVIACTVAYCYYTGQILEEAANPKSHCVTFAQQCEFLELDVVFANDVYRRVGTAFGDLELKHSHPELSRERPYGALLLLCQCVIDAADLAMPEDGKHMTGYEPLALYYARREADLRKAEDRKRALHGRGGSLVARLHQQLLDQFGYTSSVRQDSISGFEKTLRSLYTHLSIDALPEILATTQPIADIDEAVHDQNRTRLLTLVYALIQRDSRERRIRSCFLGFSYREAAELSRRFDEERALLPMGQEAEFRIDRKRFTSAYAQVKGRRPNPMLLDRILPTSANTLLPQDILDNAVTNLDDSRERSFLHQYAQEQVAGVLKTERAIKFLPFLAFFIAYLAAQLGREEAYWLSTATASYVTNEKFPALSADFPNDCHPNCQLWNSLYQSMLADIALREDLNNWLNGPVISRFWPRLSARATGPIDGSNMPIGALRIRQLRTKPAPKSPRFEAYLPQDGDFYSTAQRSVIPTWFSETFNGIAMVRDQVNNGNSDEFDYGSALSSTTHPIVRDGFRYKTWRELNSSVNNYRGRDANYGADGFALIIPFNLTGAEAAAIVQSALANNWIDLNTRAIFVETYVYSRNLQSINRARFAVEMTPGGILLPSFDSIAFAVFDVRLVPVVWFIFISIYLLLALHQILSAVYQFMWSVPRKVTTKTGITGWREHFGAIRKRSLTDWTSVLALLGAVLLVVTWVLRGFWFYYDMTVLGPEIVQVEYMPSMTERIMFLMQVLNYIHAIHCGVVTLQVLDFLSLNDRFAVVTKTIRRAALQLAALAFVFVVALIAFAIAGHIAFGMQILEYCTMPRALGNTLLAVLGEYDYDAWKRVHLDYAPVYFVLFQFVVVLLLLNMVITVLMDTFENVTSGSFKADDWLLLIENDETVTIPKPSFATEVANLTLLNQVQKSVGLLFLYSKQAIWRLEKLCGFKCELVDRDFNFRHAMHHLSRLDHYRFWKAVALSIDLIQSGSPFRAAVGHAALAEMTLPLIAGDYDRLYDHRSARAKAAEESHSKQHDGEKNDDNDPDGAAEAGGLVHASAFDHIRNAKNAADATLALVEGANKKTAATHFYQKGEDESSAAGTDADHAHQPQRKTVLGNLEEEYKPKWCGTVLRLFQELPNYHLQVPTKSLLLSLAESRHNWRQQIDDHTAGDDDDESLTPAAANDHINRIKAEVVEAALTAVCAGDHRVRMYVPRRRHFNFGGFYPMISPVQAKKIRTEFNKRVDTYRASIETGSPSHAASVSRSGSPARPPGSPSRGGPGAFATSFTTPGETRIAPYAVTIGDMADIFKHAGVGSPYEGSADDDGDHTIWMQPIEFRSISEPITLPSGLTYEFVGVLSLEALLHSSVVEYQRRKLRILARDWETPRVAAFLRAASAFRHSNGDSAHEFALDRDIVFDDNSEARRGSRKPTNAPNVAAARRRKSVFAEDDGDDELLAEDPTLSMAFIEGFEAARGAKLKDQLKESFRETLRNVTFREFLNYATKTPGAHDQHGFFRHFVEHMLHRSGEIYHFMWYLLFVIFFTIYALTGRGLNQSANLTASMQELMETQQYTFPQVNKTDDQFIYLQTLDDWKGFVTEIILPTIYAADDGTGQLPLPNLGATAVGALKIRQLRAPTYDCSDKLSALVTEDPAWSALQLEFYSERREKFFRTDGCTQKWSAFGPESRPFGLGTSDAFLANASIPERVRNAYMYSECSRLRAVGASSTDYNRWPCGGYALVLPLNTTLASASADFSFLMSNDWIDDNTVALAVELIYFHYGSNVFSRWRFLDQVEGGSSEPRTHLVNFVPWIDDEYDNTYLGFLGIFLLLLLVQIWLYLSTVRRGYKACFAHSMGFIDATVEIVSNDLWVGINFIALSLFIAAWGIRGHLMGQRVDNIHVYDSNQIVDRVEYLADWYGVLEVLDSVCALFTYGRLVSYFHLVPTLGLVGRTIVLAIPNMSSLLFVFLVIFWCFTMVGYTLFGATFAQFSTILLTMETLFKVLLGEDLDYNELSALVPGYAGFYFAAFLIVCAFVIFNLIIAVLNAAFSEAREEQYDMGPLGETIDHDARASVHLKDASGSTLVALLYAEIRLLGLKLRYYVLYPFSTHSQHQKLRSAFYRNPRHFWARALRCFEADNPAHAWFRFIDEDCDMKQVLGVESRVNVVETRVEDISHLDGKNIASKGPSPARTNRALGAHTEPFDDRDIDQIDHGSDDEAPPPEVVSMRAPDALHHGVKRSFADTYAAFTASESSFSSSIGSVSRFLSNILSKGSRAADSHQHEHSTEPVARSLLSPKSTVNKAAKDKQSATAARERRRKRWSSGLVGTTMSSCVAGTEIEQSFVDTKGHGPPHNKWRIQRVNEMFQGAMGSDSDDGWVLACICSEVTKLNRRFIVERLLTTHNQYSLDSQTYDGRSVASFASAVRSIAEVAGTLSSLCEEGGTLSQSPLKSTTNGPAQWNMTAEAASLNLSGYPSSPLFGGAASDVTFGFVTDRIEAILNVERVHEKRGDTPPEWWVRLLSDEYGPKLGRTGSVAAATEHRRRSGAVGVMLALQALVAGDDADEDLGREAQGAAFRSGSAVASDTGTSPTHDDDDASIGDDDDAAQPVVLQGASSGDHGTQQQQAAPESSAAPVAPASERGSGSRDATPTPRMM